MDSQTPPRDDDPSDMTDFEKNTATEELEQLQQEPAGPDTNRIRPERGNEGANKQPGFSQDVRRASAI